MKILDLSLTYHWYDEIRAGRKTEEYRENIPFYRSRLIEGKCTGENKTTQNCFGPSCLLWEIGCNYRHYDTIRFHRGQGNPMTMLVECKGISIGYGNPNWGAPENKEVFIIRLGRILSDTSGEPDSSRKK